MRLALLVLLAACTAAEPPPSLACRPAPRPPGIVVAGSGSNLALARATAARFEERNASVRVVIPNSIGTGGAIAALRDRAIDVGLASRALRPGEADGLQVIPVAEVAWALVADRHRGVDSLSRQELLAIWEGKTRTWPDGTPITPVLREPGDSGNELLKSLYPELGAAIDTALNEERWPVAYTDQEMRDALLGTEGALGFLDLGTLRLEGLPLRMIKLDGHLPDDPGYPLIKPLALLLPLDAGPEARAFAAFSTSPAVADILASGFRPARAAVGAR